MCPLILFVGVFKFLIFLGSFGARLVVGVIEGHSSLLLTGVAFAKECGDCKSLSLIHCEYTTDFWHLVLNLFRASWVMPSNILELLYC